MNSEPKVLLLDLETSPMIAYSWGPKWETSLIEILEQSQILSYSVKWLGGKHITKGQIDFKGYKKNVLDDEKLAEELNELLNIADIVISQNGNAFDLKVLRSRFMVHNLTPPSPSKLIDTFLEAKKNLRLPSYKLDDICDYFNIGRKIKTDFSLWKGCMKGDKKSWKKLKRYNKMDVLLLEKLYLKIKPYMKTHPNYGVYMEGNVCPRCGSKKLHKRGFAVTLTRKYRRLHCQNCGGWSRSVQSVPMEKPLTNIS